MASCTYRFIPSALVDLPTQSYELKVRQQPQRAKMSVINERDRRPIEPPPILQVHWLDCSSDDIRKNLQSPFYFMIANLLSADSNELLSTQDHLAGSTVSSLHRLRDIDDTDGGFFIFGDLFCKKQGHYRLQFNLFEIVDGHVQNRQVITSDAFRTYLPKHYPGPVEATFLSRAFSDQNVKMRIRKEHRNSLGTVRKRRLGVQALMDSQLDSTPLKIANISPAAPYYQAAPADPPRIAPVVHHAIDHHQQQSMVKEQDQHPYYQPSKTSSSYRHQYPVMFTKSTTLSKDHATTAAAAAAHAYPSPPLLPANTLTSSTDEFPITLLDEYHLQPPSRPALSSTSSPVSSRSASLHSYQNSPTTLPSINFFPNDDSLSHQHLTWNEHLPVLKAVMSGYTSRSIPLVLPCPFKDV